MLAVDMDTTSHLKRSWDDERRRRGSQNRSSTRNITDADIERSRALELRSQISPGHMLPPIVTPSEQLGRQMQQDALQASTRQHGAPQMQPLPQYSPDASSKRSRLHYNPNFAPDHSRTPSRASETAAIVPFASNKPRDPPLWPSRDSPKTERLHTKLGACQVCYESKALVDKVVSGLERLEAEMRQVLASTPLARAASEVGPSHAGPVNQ